jgi:hypothetical protein
MAGRMVPVWLNDDNRLPPSLPSVTAMAPASFPPDKAPDEGVTIPYIPYHKRKVNYIINAEHKVRTT